MKKTIATSSTKNAEAKRGTVATKKVVAKVSVKHKVNVGNRTPAFSLASSDGSVVSSRALMGTRYVLYFYPKDMTPGCTAEAHEFAALAKKFNKRGIQVFGVSPDSVKSHLKFIEKEGITFPLLADVDHVIAEKFGIWVEKSMYGKKYMGINRSTFIVGEDGKIEAVYRDVKPEGHAVCVLEDLK